MNHSRATKRGRSALPAIGLALVGALFAMCVLMLGHAASAHAEHRAGVSAGAAAAASAVAQQPVTTVHAGNGHEDHAAARAAAPPADAGAIPLVAAAAFAAVAPAPAALAEAAAANGLGGMHGDAHGAMMLMVCVMALLTAAVLLLAPRVLRGLRPRFAPLRARALVVAARLPEPRPPSLIVLSISRT